MTAQPSYMREPSRRSARYEQLFAARLEIGRRLIDQMCHRDGDVTATTQFRQMMVLDQQLDRFRRYDADYLQVVAPAEDRRWHLPPGAPEDHEVAPCTLCLHGALGLDVNVVLLPSSRSPR